MDSGQYINRLNKLQYGVIGECILKSRNCDWIDGVIYIRGGQLYCLERIEFELTFDRAEELNYGYKERVSNNRKVRGKRKCLVKK